MTDKQVAWSANYYLLCFAYAMVQSAADTSFDFGTFVLDHDVMAIGNAVLMATIVFSSFGAGSVYGLLGPRKGELLGMVLLLMYFVAYSAAGYAGTDSVMQWPFYIVGAVCCGVGVALINAGLGPWAERTTAMLCSDDENLRPDAVSAKLLANFAIILYVFQSAFMLLVSALQNLLHCSFPTIILIYGVVAAVSTCVMFLVREPPAPACETAKPDCRGQVRSMMNFYMDFRVPLLMMFPLALGFAKSWKSTHLTAILEDTIGESQVGVVNLVMSLSAVVCTKVFEKLMGVVGTSGVTVIGVVSFVAAALLSLFTSLAYADWWILVFFVLIGISTGVFDSATRMLVLDHFPGTQSALGQASLTQGMFLASMISFLMGILHLGKTESNVLKSEIIVVLSVGVMPALRLAEMLRARQTRNDAATEEAKESA